MASPHALAAAKLCTLAANHLAAGGDRAGYWRLIGEADLCVDRDAEWALNLATRYSLGLLQSPQPTGPGA